MNFCRQCSSVICQAARKGDLDMMKDCLRSYPNMFNPNHKENKLLKEIKDSLQCLSLLYQALESDSFEVAEFLIQQGADVNERLLKDFRIIEIFANSRQPIHWKNELKRASFLIKHGADISTNFEFHAHGTLWFAIEQNNVDFVKLLLENGVELGGLEWAKESPLILAASNKEYETLVPLFIRYGVDATKLGVNFQNALHYLCTNEYVRCTKNAVVDIAQLLLDHGVPVDEPDLDGCSPLFRAVEHNIVSLVNFFLKHGANVNRRTNAGLTPLHRACMNRHELLIQILLENGADIDIQDGDGDTPLLKMRLNQNNLGPMVRLTRYIAYTRFKNKKESVNKKRKNGDDECQIIDVDNDDYDKNVAAIERRPILWTHYKSCYWELMKMKKCVICHYFTFFDMLDWPNNRERMVALMRKSQFFVKAFEKTNCKLLFPCYNPDIQYILKQIIPQRKSSNSSKKL